MNEKIEELGPWWENIDINGIYTNPSCNSTKREVFEQIIDKAINPEYYFNKKILDIGCNAGGTIVELSKCKPSLIVGVDYSSKYLKQAEFVTQSLGIDNCELKKYDFNGKTKDIIAKDLGGYDVIFCLGVIYHLNEKNSLEILRYMKENSKRIIMSSQDFESKVRAQVDWNVSQEGIYSLLRKAGYRGLRVLYDHALDQKKFDKTNTFYFHKKD